MIKIPPGQFMGASGLETRILGAVTRFGSFSCFNIAFLRTLHQLQQSRLQQQAAIDKANLHVLYNGEANDDETTINGSGAVPTAQLANLRICKYVNFCLFPLYSAVVWFSLDQWRESSSSLETEYYSTFICHRGTVLTQGEGHSIKCTNKTEELACQHLADVLRAHHPKGHNSVCPLYIHNVHSASSGP